MLLKAEIENLKKQHDVIKDKTFKETRGGSGLKAGRARRRLACEQIK